MAHWPATAFTPDQFNIPTSDGDIIEFIGAFSEWDIYRFPETGVGGCLSYGPDISIIKEMMDAVEEDRNKDLDRKIRIIGEALESLNHCEDTKWYKRSDSWTRTLPGAEDEREWPLHRVWAHFMLWPLDDEIEEVLQAAEEDFDYEEWINSKQYVKSLEAYNMHKLLAFVKGQAPQWVGECTEDNVRTGNLWAPRAPLYNTYLKERYRVNAVIRTEFPNQWGNIGYAVASSDYGDIYIPKKFCGYIGRPGAPQQMTVALQDVGGNGRKGNGFRWTCIYTH